MKKPILITVLIFATLAAAYFGYERFLSPKQISAWDLIPQETVLVYESSNCAPCVEQIRSSPVSEILRRAAIGSASADSLRLLQDLLLSFQQPTLVSLHVTRKDEFEFVYYIQTSTAFEQKLKQLIEGLGASSQTSVSQRAFNGVNINELAVGKRTFSWIQVGNILAGSFSPVLVEDAIRAMDNKTGNFRTAVSGIYQLPRIKNDGGNLYLNLPSLNSWLSLFAPIEENVLIKKFGQSALLDIKLDDGRIVLNGFSAQAGNDFFLSAFREQSPMPFGLKNYISNRTVMVSSYGISDGKKFFQEVNAKIKNPNSDSVVAMFESMGANSKVILDDFSGEIAVCTVEGRKNSPAKILLLSNTKGVEKWKEAFSKVSSNVIADTVFYDRFGAYEIFEFPVYRFPEKLFYPVVTGFNNSYYTVSGNTVIVGDDIEELKKFLADIDQDNTWGKTLKQNRFLETTLLESNISLFINTPRIWNMLTPELKTKWKEFVTANQDILQSPGMGAIQFSHLNDTYYTNVSWAFSPAGKSDVPVATDRFITSFESGVANIYPVENHNNKKQELLVQDTLKSLHLVTPEGRVEWKVPLNDFIRGSIHQIDFYNNGKLQYFFATAGMLHVIDRTGAYVKPYPLSIKEANIESSSVIDYDFSRKYRFVIASSSGRVWMFDKEGRNLEGWAPRSVDESLTAPVRHHRILARDYLMAMRRDGLVYLMNRRGELIKGFPLDLGTKLSGDYFLEPGKDRERTLFTVVSVDGTKIVFNLAAKIVSREVLLKNSADAAFSLVREQSGKSYIIVRKEPRMFTVFGENSSQLISSDYIGNNPSEVGYYSYGNGIEYITVTDISQELSFVFNKAGKLVIPVPVESDHLRLARERSDKVTVFTSFEKSVSINALP